MQEALAAALGSLQLGPLDFSDQPAEKPQVKLVNPAGEEIEGDDPNLESQSSSDGDDEALAHVRSRHAPPPKRPQKPNLRQQQPNHDSHLHLQPRWHRLYKQLRAK